MNIRLKHSGFSLIELMIVVAIVAILASIAYPAYTDSILKGKRAEGRTALTELMQQQERFMTQTNSYCAFTNTSGVTAVVAGCTSVPFKTFSGDNASNAAYYLSADACPPSTTATAADMRECVRLSAVPIRNDAAAGTLQLLSTGEKACTGANSTVCWK